MTGALPIDPPSRPALLVVAKAPVPGLAKTRLGRLVGDDAAADLAAAALLDTLDAVHDASRATGWPVVVAMTGEVERAARVGAVREALDRTLVVEQRGDDFGARLAHAHLDAAAVADSAGTVQIGMDTPQVTVDDLLLAGEHVRLDRPVLGPAADGGWWLLGLPDPAAADALRDVPMSRDDTGALTDAALGGGLPRLRTLLDVDEWPDACAVAAELPGSRFAAAVARCTVETRRSEVGA